MPRERLLKTEVDVKVNQIEILQMGVLKKGLELIIKTPHLVLRSACTRDQADYIRLFGDPKVMAEYLDGNPVLPIEIEKRIKMYEGRLEAGNSFFSGLAIFERNDSKPDGIGEFVGHIVVGGAGKNYPGGTAMAALLTFAQFWNKGYGTEASSAVGNVLIPGLLKSEYKSPIDSKTLECKLPNGQPLQRVIITTGPKHEYAQKIAKSVGMTRPEENKVENIPGKGERLTFSITKEKLLELYEHDNHPHDHNDFHEHDNPGPATFAPH